jgi:hypothetical protein
MQTRSIKTNKRYKAYLVLSKHTVHVRWIDNEIPDYLTVGIKCLRLKMVMWDCSSPCVRLQCLIYR